MSVELTDDQARTALFKAVVIVQDVLEMVRGAMAKVDKTDADAIHAAQLRAQRQRIQSQGAILSEKTIVRAHPLYPLWKLATNAARLLDGMLSVTNPKLYAMRMQTQFDIRRAIREADKLTEKASAA